MPDPKNPKRAAFVKKLKTDLEALKKLAKEAGTEADKIDSDGK